MNGKLSPGWYAVLGVVASVTAITLLVLWVDSKNEGIGQAASAEILEREVNVNVIMPTEKARPCPEKYSEQQEYWNNPEPCYMLTPSPAPTETPGAVFPPCPSELTTGATPVPCLPPLPTPAPAIPLCPQANEGEICVIPPATVPTATITPCYNDQMTPFATHSFQNGEHVCYMNVVPETPTPVITPVPVPTETIVPAPTSQSLPSL